MPRTGSWLRVFVGLLTAVIPPMFVLVATVLNSGDLLRYVGSGVLALAVLAAVIAWPAILGVLYARMLADDYRSLLSLAARGDTRADREEGGAALGELAMALEERNRQVSTLATMAGKVPIEEDPRRVVAALIETAREVMRDPTWRLAVLSSGDNESLPRGTYHGEADPDPLTDLEQWASVSDSETTAGRADGPWGAFTVVHLGSGERLSAILYAPWEGRPEPTPAELALLALVGQHAGTALEHSLLYAQVQSQADDLTRLAAVQADFLRGVTHDLQTPLSSIGALATELRANQEVPDVARTDLESITHQAERLRRMVSQLLVASRLEAGVLTPRQEVFAVPPLVERTWAALRADRPFAFEVEGGPQLAVGDPDSLEQVMWAVLENAVKYSPDGSEIRVTVRPAADGGNLALTISDKGIGMDEETQARASEQFYRSDQARRVAPNGSGVGLYATRGLIEAMGGSVRIRSTLGRGTEMTLIVPAESVGAEAE